MSQKSMTLLKECIPIFSMLQDERRQEILMILFDHQNLTVNEIAEKMTLSRPTVSHHLKQLLQADLVSVKQVGKERYYDVKLISAKEKLESLLQSIAADTENRKNS